MADSKARGPLSVNPPNQISKDIPGSDSSIPLSPQWLLPKPGENKTGMIAVENHSIPYSGSNIRSDVGKVPGFGNEITKKKDVFRPSVLDTESDRRDRWRDEERVRDTNSSIRKDRWREGEREIGDIKKMDRWADASVGAGKHFGEARRPPSERWADPPKETGFDQRRESKWNTRWGPDNKELDKRKDYGKHGDGSHDKGMPNLVHHGKEEKEGDQHRPWRSSSSQGRGRVEPSQNHFQAGGRDNHMLGYGRGRASTIKPASIHSQAPGFLSEKDDYFRGEPSPLKYSRKIIIDAYRNVDVRMSRMLLNSFIQFPPLTQEEALEPLSLSAPTPEELDILNGIEKGDITSSGAPQLSKEGSAGRGSADLQPRRPRFGSREDGSILDDCPNDYAEGLKGVNPNISVGSPNDKQMLAFVSDPPNNSYDPLSSEVLRGEGGSYRKFDDNNRDYATFQSRTAWPSSRDHFDAPTEVHAKSSDIGWSKPQKDHPIQREQSSPKPYLAQNEWKRPIGENPVLKRLPSGIMDHDQESRKFPQLPPSPEDLVLYYRDPQGAIQGPFSGSDIIGWYEAGYFGIDLPVRLANAPHDCPFAALGDVMPHLKSKRPPPGFSAPKVSEMPEISRPSIGNQGKFLASSSGIDLIRDEQRHLQGSSGDAANRYLESLMVSNSSLIDRFPSSEGLQGYAGHSAGGPPPGTGSSDSFDFLVKRLAVDQQRLLPNAHPHWPPRDSSMVVSNPQMLQDPPMSQAKVPPLSDLPSQPLLSQNIDIDRSSSINNGIGSWSNFPPQGIQSFKDKFDVNHGQNLAPQAAFLLHQQSMAAQNHASMQNLLGQGIDNPSSMITAEKLLSSALSQDPQVLNLLQQQYLLQMQAQAPSAAQQLSLVDRILLLKQQQNQEEQLRQQQLLSQVLTEQHQRAADSSFVQLQAATAAASSATTSTGSAADQFLRQMSHQMLLAGQQVPISSVQGDRDPITGSFPHQFFGTQHPSFPSMPVEDGGAQLRNTFLESKTVQSVTESTPVDSQKDDSYVPSTGIPSNSKNESVLCTTTTDLIEQSLPSVLSEVAQENSSQRPLNNKTLVHEGLPAMQPEEHSVKDDQHINEDLNREEPKHPETREVKKSSEKKSRKQKSSKVHPPSSDQLVKGASKSSQVQKRHESEMSSKPEIAAASVKVVSSSKDDLRDSGPEVAEFVGNQNVHGSLAQRAWKAPASVKPKSLLEIQQEEQKRAQTEAAVHGISSLMNTKTLSAPWSGVVSSSDPKIFTVAHHGSCKNDLNEEESESSKSKRSQLHDLLAAEVLAKTNEVEAETFCDEPSLPLSSSQPEIVDDDNFIEAKDTKRSRKKGGKGKGSANKSSPSISSNDVAVAPSSIDKVKNTRQLQPEKDVLPAPPQGPSLSDFVPWKGVESTSPSPGPAWSTDSGKPQPISLRDILKEQGKRGVASQQVSAPPPAAASQKSQPAQISRQSSWSLSGSSPSKTAAPIQMRAQATPQSSKYKGDDDLFWGPPELSNPENKQGDFPQLGNRGSSGTKNTPVKGSSPGVALTRQKSAAGKATVVTSSVASAKSLSKGKRDGDTKYSEAMDFRNWCESESIRLTGNSDTSFLEFCVKQPKSEAEILLTQNLGSLDPNHEFIGKFLDYMEMLSSDVLAIAFQGQKDRKITSYGGRDMTSDMSMGDSDNTMGAGSRVVGADGSAKGGKKKGKKGKKVSAAVLGFNVVSNRIMMGEIQTVED